MDRVKTKDKVNITFHISRELREKLREKVVTGKYLTQSEYLRQLVRTDLGVEV